MSVEFTKNPLSECIELIIDYRGKTPKKLGGDWAEEGYRALSANMLRQQGWFRKILLDELIKKYIRNG